MDPQAQKLVTDSCGCSNQCLPPTVVRILCRLAPGSRVPAAMSEDEQQRDDEQEEQSEANRHKPTPMKTSSAVVPGNMGATPVLSLPPASSSAAAMPSIDLACMEDDPILGQITKLREEQKRLRDQKKTITKSLRNAERKKKRLRTRARQLTDSDLVAVLRLRQDLRERVPVPVLSSGAAMAPAISTEVAASGGSAANSRSSDLAADI